MYIFIISMVIIVALAAKLALSTKKLVYSPLETIDYKKELKNDLVIGACITVLFLLAMLMVYAWAKISPKWWEVLFTVICSILFAASITTFYVSFRIHYYRKGLPSDVDKLLYRLMLISIPVMIVSLFYGFNGFANYMTYPLVNGINFAHGFTTPFKSYSDGLNIAFYALVILSGALFVYALSDHKVYKEFGKHGMLDSTFLVAFPSGIIGARIWYVIGNWTVDGFDKDPISALYIWNGGLTILGGAIMGIVVGVLWLHNKHKKYSIWTFVDLIVPTILLAQAIGRLGNFFNVEVHGNPVSVEPFYWMPLIILKNGMYSSTNSVLPEGQMYLPLFFIEGLLNVSGYFLLSELFGGRKLKKYTEPGDLAFGYVCVYGFIRAALEPLRDSGYNMGENGYWSWIFSCLFVVFGALGIVGNHFVRYLLRKQKQEVKAQKEWEKGVKVNMIAVCASGLALIILGVVLMILGTPVLDSLLYNTFNLGVLASVFGLGVAIFAFIPFIYLKELKGANK